MIVKGGREEERKLAQYFNKRELKSLPINAQNVELHSITHAEIFFVNYLVIQKPDSVCILMFYVFCL